MLFFNFPVPTNEIEHEWRCVMERCGRDNQVWETGEGSGKGILGFTFLDYSWS